MGNARGKPMSKSEFTETRGIPRATFQECVHHELSKRRAPGTYSDGKLAASNDVPKKTALRTKADGKPAVPNDNSSGSPKTFSGSKLCEGIIPSRLQFHNHLSLMHKYETVRLSDMYVDLNDCICLVL